MSDDAPASFEQNLDYAFPGQVDRLRARIAELEGMRFWLLRQRTETPQYDTAVGFVVAASTEAEARRLVGPEAWDEGADAWLDDELTSCEQITPDGEPRVILLSGKAG